CLIAGPLYALCTRVSFTATDSSRATNPATASLSNATVVLGGSLWGGAVGILCGQVSQCIPVSAYTSHPRHLPPSRPPGAVWAHHVHPASPWAAQRGGANSL